MKTKIKELEEELKITKAALEAKRAEVCNLKQAIWDMLDHSDIYFLMLDSNMNIVLINRCLLKALGFEDDQQLIGRCWGDFIPDDFRELIGIAHSKLTFENDTKYTELTNEIICKDTSKKILVKWLNVPVNGVYNITLSFGLPKRNTIVDNTEESIRSYYSDLLEKDKSMIDTLRDSFLLNKTHVFKEG